MEFREDTNDSWIWAIDEAQFGERDSDTALHWSECCEGDTDSWVWEVDESQYGRGSNDAATEEVNESQRDSVTEEPEESRHGSVSGDSTMEEMGESQYSSDGGERFYTISEVCQVRSKKFRTTAVDYSVSFNGLEDMDLVQ